MTKPKPRPNIDLDNAAFWAGVEQHRFLLTRCQDCGAWYWPMAHCKECPAREFGSNMVWEEASGLGTVFACNIHRIAFDPSFADDIPYVYAMIELDEGPLFSTSFIGCEVDEVKVGARARIVFETNTDQGFSLPKAELIRE